MSIAASSNPAETFAAKRALSPYALAAAGVLLLAVAQQCVGHQNTDNSWLITVDEMILSGAKPYVDIIETNPPASFLIYMPAVWLAHVLGAHVEFVVAAFVFAMAFTCIALSGRILSKGGLLPRAERGPLLIAALFAFILMPGFSFGEREHLAVIWIAPMLAVYAVRMAGGPVAWRGALLAGLLAGGTLAIKPHFALALALVVLWRVAAERRPAVLFTLENWAAGGAALAFVAMTFVFYPAFFDRLPEVIDAYVPIKQHLPALLTAPWFIVNMVLLAAALLIGRGNCLKAPALPLLLASIGFTATYFWQAKGWMNHELPAVTLLVMALASLIAPLLADAGGNDWRRARPFVMGLAAPAVLLTPVLFGSAVQWTGAEEHEGLTAAVLRNAPPRPGIIAMSQQLSVGHPLTRRIGGHWAGRTHSLLLPVAARMLLAAHRGDPDYQARLAAYVDADTADFLADVRANKPDIILVDTDPRIAAAIKDIPALAASLDGYEPRETADDVVVWARK